MRRCSNAAALPPRAPSALGPDSAPAPGGATAPLAQSADPISYTVRFAAPATHYAEIDVVLPVDGRPAVELMMAAWTPGSY